MERIYLDYAATTPMDKEVEKAMKPYFGVSGKFGNPSSLHFFGQEALGVVDKSRSIIAKSLGLDSLEGFKQIVFTGSATEANNLAIRGVVKNLKNKKGIRIIVSSIEHDSVLETAKDLEKDGIDVVYLPVNKNGIVDLKVLKESLNDMTALVSVMYVNNEIGSIQPIEEIAKIIEDFKKEKSERQILSHYPLLHVDAVQAFQYLSCDVKDLGADLMTLSAHKIYGPKGVGALYIKKQNLVKGENNQSKSLIESIMTGGSQEFGMRAGTENVPAIVGFGKAAEITERNRKEEYKKIENLRNYFWQKIKSSCKDVSLNNDFDGSTLSAGSRSKSSPYKTKNIYAPHILNIAFGKNFKTNDLLIAFDLQGLAVSAGSACGAHLAKPSHVLKAMKLPEKTLNSSIRFSLGKFTTKQDIDKAVKIIKSVMNQESRIKNKRQKLMS